jgi:peptidoglycan/xylan/chitin deacetylase (PgdA/CDA1 family)
VKAILTYHSIDPSGSPISVDADTFRRHVRWLASGAVRVVSVPELVRLPDDADAVALTFDDGFASFGAVAAPLLLDHALPATVFVVTDHVGRTNAWGGVADPAVPTLPLLDWSALARLAERGIAIGAHTRTHPRLTRLDPAARREEIASSVGRIERELGERPAGLAYPYGDVDDDAAAAAAAHCDWACTTELRALAPGDAARPHLLPRLDIHYLRSPGRLESWGTPRLRRYLWLRGRARRVRAGLAAWPR